MLDEISGSDTDEVKTYEKNAEGFIESNIARCDHNEATALLESICTAGNVLSIYPFFSSENLL